MKKEVNIDDIIFLDNQYKLMSKNMLLDLLPETCTPKQTELIMSHIDLLGDNMLIGYHTKEDRVFTLFTDTEELLEIKKKI